MYFSKCPRLIECPLCPLVQLAAGEYTPNLYDNTWNPFGEKIKDNMGNWLIATSVIRKISDLISTIFYTEKKYFLATFFYVEMAILCLELLLKVWLKKILQH